MTQPGSRPRFASALREGVRLRDVLLLSFVPVLLVAIYRLPETRRRSLAFSYLDPTALTAWTAHFVHLDPGHLIANLLGYVVLATVGYLLATLAGRRGLFAVMLTTYLLVFPPVLSLLNLAVPRPAITYGFSGVNMALAGVLPLVLVEFVGARLFPLVRPRDAPGLFFLVMTLIALVAIPTTTTTLAIAVGAGLAALLYGTSFLRSAWSARRGEDRGTHRIGGPLGGWLELGAVGLLVAIGYPLIGFPADPAGGGRVVNLYVHLLGYSLAFIGPYVGLEIGVLE
ncbi:MAG: hypothetical protein ABEJ55_08435 [Halanaeroarchaeum sp.]